MAVLRDRASRTGSVDDGLELSLLQTTVRRIEELMQVATEYEEVLTRKLARTNTIINSTSG